MFSNFFLLLLILIGSAPPSAASVPKLGEFLGSITTKWGVHYTWPTLQMSIFFSQSACMSYGIKNGPSIRENVVPRFYNSLTSCIRLAVLYCENNTYWSILIKRKNIQESLEIIVEDLSDCLCKHLDSAFDWTRRNFMLSQRDYNTRCCWLTTLIARFTGPAWAHLGPTGPRWVPCRSHDPCYLGTYQRASWWSPPPGLYYAVNISLVLLALVLSSIVVAVHRRAGLGVPFPPYLAKVLRLLV